MSNPPSRGKPLATPPKLEHLRGRQHLGIGRRTLYRRLEEIEVSKVALNPELDAKVFAMPEGEKK